MAVTQRKNVANKDSRPVKGGEDAVETTTSKNEVAEGPHTDRKLQGLILLILAAPWAIYMAMSKASPQDIGRSLVQDLRLEEAANERTFLDDPRFWYIVAALSTPHVFYLFVWTNASVFYKIFKPFGEPFEVFALAAHAIKLFQMCALAVWYFGFDFWMSKENIMALPEQTIEFFASRGDAQLILAGELFMLGQLFNGGVYQSIGEAGVYYGCRLGKQVPWVFGFPFSVVPHPQYLGATVSIWGGVFLCASAVSVPAGIYAIGIIMTGFYFFSSMVEQHL